MKNTSFLKASFAGLVLVATISSGLAFGAHPFTDVPDGKFYTEAVDWAFNLGITTGTSATTFEPDASVTRGENITFAKRYDDFVVQPALDDRYTKSEVDAAIAATTHWARVNADCSLLGSSGSVTSEERSGFAHICDVTFPVDDLADCATTGTAAVNGTDFGSALLGVGLTLSMPSFFIQLTGDGDAAVHRMLEDDDGDDDSETTLFQYPFDIVANC